MVYKLKKEKFDFSINMTCLYNDFQNSRSGWFQLESLSYVRSIQVIKVSKIHSSNAINKIYLEFNPDIKEVKKKSKSKNSNLLELNSFHEYTNIYNYQVNSLTYDETMIYRIAGGYLNDYFFYLKETNNSPWKARWKNLIHKTTERIKNFIEASLNEILYTEISISEKIKFNNYFDSHKVYFNKNYLFINGIRVINFKKLKINSLISINDKKKKTLNQLKWPFKSFLVFVIINLTIATQHYKIKRIVDYKTNRLIGHKSEILRFDFSNKTYRLLKLIIFNYIKKRLSITNICFLSIFNNPCGLASLERVTAKNKIFHFTILKTGSIAFLLKVLNTFCKLIMIKKELHSRHSIFENIKNINFNTVKKFYSIKDIFGFSLIKKANINFFYFSNKSIKTSSYFIINTYKNFLLVINIKKYSIVNSFMCFKNSLSSKNFKNISLDYWCYVDF